MWLPLFRSFDGSLVKWRWGYMAKAVADLVSLEHPLRTCWNTERVGNRDARQGDGADDQHNFQGMFAVTDEAIRPDTFWSFLRMLNILAGLYSHMEAWSESCCCHSEASLSESRTHAAICMERLGMPSCPWRN